MKKVLSAALALGLVAGVASTASAAYDNFRISGWYQLNGIMAMSTNGNDGVDLGSKAVAGEQDRSEANATWYEQDFRIYPVLEVNDKIKVSSEVRLMDSDVWGMGDSPGDAGGGTGQIDVDKLYMEWTMDYGKLRMGRIPWGAYGPDFITTAGRNEGFVLYSNLLPKPWGLTLVTGKLTEGDLTATTSDEDVDYYDVRVNYTTDKVNVHTRVGLTNDMNTATEKDEAWHWGGYGKVNMDNLFVEFEWDHKFGSIDYDNAAQNDDDYDSWAYMVNLGGKFDALDANIMYAYVSGDDNENSAASNTDGDDESYGSIGEDFMPLMILFGDKTGLLNPDVNTAGSYNVEYDIANVGIHAVIAQFGYKVSDKLSLSSAIGTAWADEEKAYAAAAEDDFGWEINVGASYKLLDNLTYSANFGYLDVGDFFVNGPTAAAGDDLYEDSVVLIAHSLNMTF